MNAPPFWVLISVGIALNVLLYAFIVWFFFKEKIKTFAYRNANPGRYIRAYIVFPNNRIVEFNTTYKNDKTFEFESGKYNVVDKKIKFTDGKAHSLKRSLFSTDANAYDMSENEFVFTGIWGNIPTLYYVHGNPNPISFQTCIKKNVGENAIEIDSFTYKDALEQKIIRDLLNDQKQLLILYILVGINIILSAFIALKVFGIIDKITKKGG